MKSYILFSVVKFSVFKTAFKAFFLNLFLSTEMLAHACSAGVLSSSSAVCRHHQGCFCAKLHNRVTLLKSRRTDGLSRSEEMAFQWGAVGTLQGVCVLFVGLIGFIAPHCFCRENLWPQTSRKYQHKRLPCVFSDKSAVNTNTSVIPGSSHHNRAYNSLLSTLKVCNVVFVGVLSLFICRCDAGIKWSLNKQWNAQVE